MLHGPVPLVSHAPCPAERLAAALEFLARPDLAELPLGRQDIMGDEVFANVQAYDTVPADEKDYEAHRAYLDIQYLISGGEKILVAPLGDCEAVGEFDGGNDFGLYKGPAHPTVVVMAPGDLCLLTPEEAHKPGCALDGPTPVSKIVVKVAVD